MDDDQIRAVTREVVAEVLELDPGELRDVARFSELGATSVQQMEIVVVLGSRFGVKYSLDEEGQVSSIDDAVTITRGHLS